MKKVSDFRSGKFDSSLWLKRSVLHTCFGCSEYILLFDGHKILELEVEKNLNNIKINNNNNHNSTATRADRN